MGTFRLSRRAEDDIARHTLRTWGEDQAIRYIDSLEECCQKLADNPSLGRPCDYIRRGLRRMEHARRVLFYRRKARGVLISRILHRRMLPERLSPGDEP